MLPAGQPLAGKVVGIDPGHNGLNYTNPTFLNTQVFNGRTEEDCDTTGPRLPGVTPRPSSTGTWPST